jgi:large subunit ribosomal protein L10
MPRPEKVQAVAEIKERLERARAVFLAEYAGLSVKEQQKLRRGLRKGGAEFKVVKMTLARRAAADLQLAELDELFLGPTGIAFTDGDPVTAAKALKDFAKENESFIVKGGLLGAEFLSPERISELAEIESRDVLLAKLAGAMKAPMANLAGLAAALPRNLASALQQAPSRPPRSKPRAPRILHSRKLKKRQPVMPSLPTPLRWKKQKTRPMNPKNRRILTLRRQPTIPPRRKLPTMTVTMRSPLTKNRPKRPRRNNHGKDDDR